MSTTLSIKLKRASKVYHEGETVAGVVVVDSGTETRHEGLTLVLEGSVSLQLSNKNTGILDAFSNNVKTTKMRRLLTSFPKHLPQLPFHKKSAPTQRYVSSDPSLQTMDSFQDASAAEELGPERNKSLESSLKMFESKEKTPLAFPINLITTALELVSPGKIPAGVTEIPFEVPLRARGPPSAGYPGLLETYHGVFVNVMYSLKATMRRPLFNKPLNASCQFFLQYRQQEVPPPKPVRCEITPASVRAGGGGGGAGGAGGGVAGGGGGRGTMPSFHIYAEIDSTVCALDKPITGLIRVDECSVPIKSIELQLVRVETCGAADGCERDATEIQNIQVGAGDVARGRALPLHMVLPRLFTAPTTAHHHFKIEFELNIAVIFEDDYLITENFPILLLRCR